MMRNISLHYLYRDAGNYKKWSDVIFSNPDNLSAEVIAKRLSESFMEDGLFVAHQVRIPEVFLAADGQFTDDDHCFHEFSEVTVTEEASNDLRDRSIGEFLEEVLRESQHGWLALNPRARLSGTRR